MVGEAEEVLESLAVSNLVRPKADLDTRAVNNLHIDQIEQCLDSVIVNCLFVHQGLLPHCKRVHKPLESLKCIEDVFLRGKLPSVGGGLSFLDEVHFPGVGRLIPGFEFASRLLDDGCLMALVQKPEVERG